MLLSVSLQASDALLSASSQREADRSFAAYTNNELRVVATTVDEWDDSNPYKIVDRLPAKLRDAGIGGALLDRDTGALTSLLKAFEEGGEMMMALLALLAILQAHLIFNRKGTELQ